MATRSYGKCPHCSDEISTSGIKLHIKTKHSEKYKEFKFAEWKQSTTRKDSRDRAADTRSEPVKVEFKPDPKPDQVTHPHHPDPKPEPRQEPVKKESDTVPAKGKSFLDEFDEWLDSDEL